MSESPELSGKRKWILEQRADPPPGARPKGRARIQDERAIDWQVVEMSDTPALWPARMKKAFMVSEMGEFRCKVCNACTHDLQSLIDHYTSRHFNNDTHTHVAMQKRALNISTLLSSRELGKALEVIKKHGKRRNLRIQDGIMRLIVQTSWQQEVIITWMNIVYRQPLHLVRATQTST
eukprot:3816348-Amphidinium_carterae.4